MEQLVKDHFGIWQSKQPAKYTHLPSERIEEQPVQWSSAPAHPAIGQIYAV